jgi:hypothetical protein
VVANVKNVSFYRRASKFIPEIEKSVAVLRINLRVKTQWPKENL